MVKGCWGGRLGTADEEVLGACEGSAGQGWNGGREAPQWKALSVPAAVTAICILVDVQVSEIVKGGPKGPARFHVVNFLGELQKRKGMVLSVTKHSLYWQVSVSSYNSLLCLPAAPCCPWSRSPLLRDKWCMSNPCKGMGWHGIWSFCCTLEEKRH